MSKQVLLSVALSVLAVGCGRQTTPPGALEGTIQGPVDPYGDPRSYAGDPFAGFLAARTVELPAGEGAEPDSGNAGASTEVPVEPGRWCIQIAACSTQEDARGVSDLAGTRTDLDCSIDAEGPWWKVRLGSFPTREAAEARLGEVRSLGYGDAWVVERPGGD